MCLQFLEWNELNFGFLEFEESALGINFQKREPAPRELITLFDFQDGDCDREEGDRDFDLVDSGHLGTICIEALENYPIPVPGTQVVLFETDGQMCAWTSVPTPHRVGPVVAEQQSELARICRQRGKGVIGIVACTDGIRDRNTVSIRLP